MDNKVMHARYKNSTDFRIGRVAACRKGKIGIILKKVSDKWGGVLYKGIRPDGRPWQSSQPCIIAEEDARFIMERYFAPDTLEKISASLELANG